MHDGVFLSQHPRTLTRNAVVDGQRDGGLCDHRLQVRIRALLLNQTLPPVDGTAWAGMGSGVNQCACCGESIPASRAEYEPGSAAGRYAHAEWFNIWREESIGLRVFDPHVNGDRHRETASGS